MASEDGYSVLEIPSLYTVVDKSPEYSIDAINLDTQIYQVSESEIPSCFWYIFTVEDVSIRKGIRFNMFVVDITLTGTGFDGDEGVDWENLRYDEFAESADQLITIYNDGSGGATNPAAFMLLTDVADENTIYVKNGTYNLDSVVDVFGKKIIIGESKEGVIFHGTFDGTFFHGHYDDDTLDVEFRNLTIEGTGQNEYAYDTSPNEGGIYFQAEYGVHLYERCFVKDCIFKDMLGWGVQAKNIKLFQVEDCHFENLNFVAITSKALVSVIRGITTDKVRMFLECIGWDDICSLSISQIRSTLLSQYGLRFYGAGSIDIEDAVFDRIGDTNYVGEGYWGMAFHVGMYYISPGTGIVRITAKDVILKGWGEGTHIKQYGEIEKIGELNYNNVTTEETDEDFVNEGVVIDTLIMN